jgi:cytochrome c556
LTIVEHEDEPVTETENGKEEEAGKDVAEPKVWVDEGEVAAQAERIIADAKAQLDALGQEKGANAKPNMLGTKGALVMAGGVDVGTAGIKREGAVDVEDGRR